MADFLLLISMGALAGMMAGLLGIGGGIIIVPVLALVFQHQAVDAAVLMHVAIGTSLATIVITSLSSTRAHQQHGAIDWTVFKTITPGILIGALLGAVVADAIEGELLRYLFIGFMFIVAAQMAGGMVTKPHRRLPARPGMLGTGTVIGVISSMMGIGGGSLSVPFLTWCNMEVRRAIATSSAIGLPIAVAGTLGFIINGWSEAGRPAWSIGYVNLPAFLGIIVASTAFAPLGARLAHRIPPLLLKRIFAVFLVIVAVRMLAAS
jgi:uncharacterized membrane protein YfcA